MDRLCVSKLQVVCEYVVRGQVVCILLCAREHWRGGEEEAGRGGGDGGGSRERTTKNKNPTQRCWEIQTYRYTDKLPNTDTHRDTCLRKKIDARTHRQTQPQTDTHTQGRFYAQKLYTHKRLRPDAFIHKKHKDALTHKSF